VENSGPPVPGQTHAHAITTNPRPARIAIEMEAHGQPKSLGLVNRER